MDEDMRPPDDVTTRTARCAACGRPVWPAAAKAGEKPAPPPELCDYCAAVSRCPPRTGAVDRPLPPQAPAVRRRAWRGRDH